MLNWLKKYFIPHGSNNHRPHFLQAENTRYIVLSVLFIEAFLFLAPTLIHINKSGGMAAVLPSILSNLTNEERIANKEAVLAVNPTLNKAAEMKAIDMATKSYFAHTSPEGKTPWYWLEKVGYNYQYAGENLAVNFTDSKDVTNAWMTSPTHKANIVKGNYTEMGTGIATGVYEGKETIFVAQVYANPLPKQAEAINPNNVVAKTTKETPKVATTKEATNILGAETSTNIGNNPDNIQIDKLIIIDQTPKPTFLQKIFASPRNSTNIIFFIIFGVIILSLVLNIIIKVKRHHLDLITNGLVTLALIGAILVANYYISNKNMVTTSNLDYSSENK